MKILYIDHPEADQLSALVYMGLCQELGAENVVDWPWKHSYHGQSYEGPVPYDPPGTRGITSPFSWMIPQNTRAWSNEEVFSRVNEFDLVVLASPRVYNTRDLANLIDRVGRQSLKRLVMIDGEDYTTVRWDLAEKFHPSVYFKLSAVENPFDVYHEAKARMSGLVRVVPFPQASPLPSPAPVPKDIDVVFFGGGNWQPFRKEGIPADLSQTPVLKARLAQEFESYMGGHLPHSEYMAAINRAKIAVCVGGSGIEPLRTYEILSCPGTLLARERIPVMAPYPLIDGVNHVGFDGTNQDEIVRILRETLSDEPKRQRIAAEGNRLLREHYTPRARAQQLLEESFR